MLVQQCFFRPLSSAPLSPEISLCRQKSISEEVHLPDRSPLTPCKPSRSGMLPCHPPHPLGWACPRGRNPRTPPSHCGRRPRIYRNKTRCNLHVNSYAREHFPMDMSDRSHAALLDNTKCSIRPEKTNQNMLSSARRRRCTAVAEN